MATTSTPESAARSRIAKVAANVIITTAFLALVVLGIWLFRERHWVLSPVTFCAALMCIPLVDHNLSWKDRFLASVVMPFAMLGLTNFVALYVLMFHFAWFESIFNNEGAGPLGLIFSAIAGLVVGGWAGVKFMKRLTGPDLWFDAPANRGTDGESDDVDPLPSG